MMILILVVILFDVVVDVAAADAGGIPVNPLTSRPGCIPGSRYTGVGVLFFVI